jgi:hypothetical protein
LPFLWQQRFSVSAAPSSLIGWLPALPETACHGSISRFVLPVAQYKVDVRVRDIARAEVSTISAEARLRSGRPIVHLPVTGAAVIVIDQYQGGLEAKVNYSIRADTTD